MPFSTRSNGDNHVETDIDKKKKVSQSAAEDTLRHYRQALIASEAYDN
jgi:hypothetical protein